MPMDVFDWMDWQTGAARPRTGKVVAMDRRPGRRRRR